MSDNFTIEQLTPQPTVALRARVAMQELPTFFPKAYEQVMRYMEEQNVQAAGAPYGLYRRMEDGKLDVEAGFPVSRELPGSGDIVAGAIAGAQALVYEHRGSYMGLPRAHELVHEHVRSTELELRGECYEFYVDDPNATAEAELRTRIAYPLREGSTS